MPRPNRGLRLERNERGIYEARWSEGGRSKRISSRTADPIAAAAFFSTLTAGLERQRDEQAAATISGVLARYFDEHVHAGKVLGTDTADKARRHLEQHFALMAPADVAPSDVRAYVRRRDHQARPQPGDGPKIGAHAAGSTVRRELGVLIAALNHAVRERRLSKSDVPEIPLPEAGAPREDYLSEAEVAALFRAAAEDRPGGRMSRVERWLFLAYHTGRRDMAIRRLTWRRVNFETGLIDFDEPGRRKTKKRRGIAVMNDTLRAALLRAFDEKGQESEYVLDHPGHLRKSMESLRKRAGVAKLHPHLLKHTHITHMLRKGVSVWDASGASATSAATIERVYGKHVPEALRAAVKVLG